MAQATCSNCGYPYAVACKGCPNCGATFDCGCFVTTAVVKQLGCADNGKELQAFRAFRDGYMYSTPERQHEVELYYRVAPSIVAQINAGTEPNRIYAGLWEEHLAPAYFAILSGQEGRAHEIYSAMMRNLITRYPVEGA